MQYFSNKKHKIIFEGSVLLSVCLHVMALLFLQRQSVWFSPAKTISPAIPWIASMAKLEKEQFFKEAFQPSSLPSLADANPFEALEEGTALSFRSDSVPLGLPSALEFLVPPDPFPTNELLVSHQLPSFSLPTEDPHNLLDHLPRDLIVPKPSRGSPPPPASSPSLIAGNTTLQIPILPQIAEVAPPIAAPPPFGPEYHPEPPLAPSSLFLVPSPQMPALPTLKELKTSTFSDFFDTDITFFPLEEGGALFAITFIPHTDLQLTPIRQNYFFLIDRSNSIQKDRLHATKQAVQKAIGELEQGDTFNIIAFDNKIEKLSPVSLALNESSLLKGRAFLDTITLGSFFAHSDLFKSLFLTIPYTSVEDELYAAILLTDGESLNKKGNTYTLLNEWTRLNQGKVSLFVVGLESDLNLPALDTVCAFNRGKLFTSSTKRGIKRKLLKAMKTLHTPIAKSMSCRAISRSTQGVVELCPKGSCTPHLYLDEPYTILGKTNSFDDFVLFVQGRLNGGWLHIKKTISLNKGKKGGAALQAEWALHKAYELYDRYLIDENPEHLTQAKLLLTPHNLRLPFE